MKFKVGDVVRVAGIEGPDMVVVRMDSGGGEIETRWFLSCGSRAIGFFPEAVLALAKPGVPRRDSDEDPTVAIPYSVRLYLCETAGAIGLNNITHKPTIDIAKCVLAEVMARCQKQRRIEDAMRSIGSDFEPPCGWQERVEQQTTAGKVKP